MNQPTKIKIFEIENGYLLAHGPEDKPQYKSFQWAVGNDQRKDLVQHVINILGIKHDYILKER